MVDVANTKGKVSGTLSYIVRYCHSWRNGNGGYHIYYQNGISNTGKTR